MGQMWASWMGERRVPPWGSGTQVEDWEEIVSEKACFEGAEIRQ
jgi:hypothetical protein